MVVSTASVTASPNDRITSIAGSGIDDRHVAAEEHRLDTVGRHREIERSASIRRRIEPDMREHRAPLVDAACGHALELDRRAAGEDREDDVEVGPPRGAGREPGDVRGLHLRGVVDDRRPPRRGAGRSDGGARVDEQQAAALHERVEPGCEYVELEQLRAGDAEAGESRAPARRQRAGRSVRRTRRPSPGSRTPRSRSARALRPNGSRSIPSVGCSETTARSSPSRSISVEPCVELVRLDVELPHGRSGELELATAQARGLRSRRERGEERRRPEVLVDVGRRHGATLSWLTAGSVRNRHWRARADPQDEPGHRGAVEPDAAV